jgi:hypothetical protein
MLTVEIKSVEQAKQLENPNAIIQIDKAERQPLMSTYASCYQGTSTGDNPRFVRLFWEVNSINNTFEFMEGVPSGDDAYDGKHYVIDWIGVGDFPGSAIRGWEAFGKLGISLGQMEKLPSSLYMGKRFPNTTPVIIPLVDSDLPALWAFCSTPSFSVELRKINQKLSVDNGYVGKIPFDLGYWTQVAEERYPHGLPKPYSDDPTQWIFHGHPMQSTDPLQVAITRLLGYRWPAETDPDMELSDEAHHWISRCEPLLKLVDDDGIVCIPPVRGEPAAAERLLNLMAAAYGKDWNTEVLARLLKAADHADKTLDTWLREKFFTQHCKLFQHRPFIWHIWDGLRDGFAALVNYHQFDHKALETLIYTYLGDWITRQKKDIETGADGAQEKLAAADQLKHRLELILHGEAPYDIFVRWKPLAQQPIGWNPDLNDGVRLNIRPFLSVPDVGKKGAGVLRDKPNINWGKDRGKDVESAPWYPVFAGERINDHHLSLAEKRTARERTKDKTS